MKVTAKHTSEVTVQISGYEAAVLMAILRNVGGHPSGPRGVVDQLYSKLDALDLREDAVIDTDGVIYLK